MLAEKTDAFLIFKIFFFGGKYMKKVNLIVGAAIAILSVTAFSSCAKKDGGKTVKVGILHSLSHGYF